MLLAAGAARRFGANKILAKLTDELSVGLSSATHLSSAVDTLLVVVRADDARSAAHFEAAGYRVVLCTAAALGMAHSLACGIAASPTSAAWMVALADMPLIAPDTLQALAESWRRQDRIVLPIHDGRPGHPVIFPARYAAELQRLSGDRGARAVLEAHAGEVLEFVTADAGVLRDIDTLADLHAATKGKI